MNVFRFVTSVVVVCSLALGAGAQTVSTTVQAVTPGASLDAVEVGDVFEVTYTLDQAGDHAAFLFALTFGSTWEEWAIPTGESSFFEAGPHYNPDWVSAGNQTEHFHPPYYAVYMDLYPTDDWQSFAAGTVLGHAHFEYLGESVNDPAFGGKFWFTARIDGEPSSSSVGSIAYTPAPEPGTLSALGVLLFAMRRRRR